MCIEVASIHFEKAAHEPGTEGYRLNTQTWLPLTGSLLLEGDTDAFQTHQYDTVSCAGKEKWKVQMTACSTKAL